MDESIEPIEFLASSTTRVQVLHLLRGNGPLGRDELKAAVAGTRTTLSRNLDALSDRGWIESCGRKYSLTPAGEVVIDHFDPLVDAIDLTERLSVFLERFPLDETPLDIRAFEDATVAVSTPREPYAPVTIHLDALERADRVRLLLPVMGVDAMETSRRRIREAGATFEVVVDVEVAERIRSESGHLESVREMADTGHLDLSVAKESIPFYLGLFDSTTAQLGVVDDDGFPRATLETDAPEVLEWAQAEFGRFRRSANEFTPPKVDA